MRANLEMATKTTRVALRLEHSVVQWHQLSFPFFGGCPTKNGLPQKGFPFFSRVTELRGGFAQPHGQLTLKHPWHAYCIGDHMAYAWHSWLGILNVCSASISRTWEDLWCSFCFWKGVCL